MNYDNIKYQINKFVLDRGWEHYSKPRNLLLAMVGEVGELSELFQWVTDEKLKVLMNDSVYSTKVKDEIADIFLYLLRLADSLQIDLIAASNEKMKKNIAKYPANDAVDVRAFHTEDNNEKDSK